MKLRTKRQSLNYIIFQVENSYHFAYIRKASFEQQRIFAPVAWYFPSLTTFPNNFGFSYFSAAKLTPFVARISVSYTHLDVYKRQV